MGTNNSVAALLEQIKSGEDEAIVRLWDHYFPQLVRVARQRLSAEMRRVSDEEDVALSALASFCRAVRRDRFPDLTDREGLWRLLFQITVRKVIDRRRYLGRARRGGDRDGTSAAAGDLFDEPLEHLIAETPTPEFEAIMNEQCERLFALLGQTELKAVVAAKLEGFTHAEIAHKLGCSLRTVERRLELTRQKWRAELC